MNDAELRRSLARMDQPARDALRRALVADQPYRDALAERLLRRRKPGAGELADLIDMLTLDDEARRRVARLLGELEASES